MLEPFFDSIVVLKTITVIAALGGFISALEFFVIKKEFKADGLLSWEVIKFDYLVNARKSIARIIDNIYKSKAWFFIIGMRIICFALLIISTIYEINVLSTVLLAMIALSILIINFRVLYGMDGSDQMLSIVFITLFAQSLFPHDATIANICLWFICLQSVASYFIAGFAKLFSKTWISGNALALVLTTESYGKKYFAFSLIKHPILGKLGTWTVLLFECTFPIIFIGNDFLLVIYLLCGLLFHLLNALIMGLNIFTWAFVSTYPAIIYCVNSY